MNPTDTAGGFPALVRMILWTAARTLAGRESRILPPSISRLSDHSGADHLPRPV